MDTPICDFVREYARSNTHRLHMPGHKGAAFLGMEPLDITEIQGADSLYEANGIIARSEANASVLFGCRTLYSTEGSSQCIRAMLYLITLYAAQQGRKPLIAAGRNAHKTFLTAAALLDADVRWLYPQSPVSYLSCNLTAEELEDYLENTPEKPTAVYLTSPDYLGMIADIQKIAGVCHRHGVLLAVDNAHGAYLRFLPESMHPIDLGADLCCDSAHKTLPVLTGGAYLHLSDRMDAAVGAQVKNALMLFGSTSPSYLILQSLDAANRYLTDYPAQLKKWIDRLDAFRSRLRQRGYALYGSEPLKITIQAKPCGYTGEQLADILRRQNIEPEFADPDFIVLMISAETGEDTLAHLEEVLLQLPLLPPLRDESPVFAPGERALSIREAMLSCSEQLPAAQCLGRILAMPSVGCPPAVPILICGERIDAHAIGCFAYYGIDHCFVVKADT
ncbi:MAG: aminotransferase class I/II-fold pyridoxal phosphate-dependent enzyme [Clostridia bacterium]|nr:aminotransferase class I/II-fold pyridoxal phosphate-dependent enzyme [Clostridia bacterium]